MKGVNEVCEALEQIADHLLNGTLTPQVATEVNNSYGKILKGKLGQLGYYEARKEKPKIAFWDEK